MTVGDFCVSLNSYYIISQCKPEAANQEPAKAATTESWTVGCTWTFLNETKIGEGQIIIIIPTATAAATTTPQIITSEVEHLEGHFDVSSRSAPPKSSLSHHRVRKRRRQKQKIPPPPTAVITITK